MKTKIILTILVIGGLSLKNYAQDVKVNKENAIMAVKEGSNSVSAANQDVLVNYLQIAANNITSTGSNVQFKISWFALNSMDSVHKYMNKNFVKTRWQRNFQFMAAAGMDKNNKFNSIQGGISYNVWNRRDTSLHYYTDAYEPYFPEESVVIQLVIKHYKDQLAPALQDRLYKIVKAKYNQNIGNGRLPIDDLQTDIQQQIKGFPSNIVVNGIIARLQMELNTLMIDHADPNKVEALLSNEIPDLTGNVLNKLLDISINAYVKSYGKKALDFGPMIDEKTSGEIGDFIDSQVKNDPVFKPLNPKGLSDLDKKILTNYQALVHYVAQQPLLTFNYAYISGQGTALSKHIGGLQYIQSLTKLASKKTLELTGSLTDTVSSTDPTGKVRNFNRNIISIQGGFNQVLAMQKKVSVMEINAALEQDWATSGYVSKTDKTRFYFNAYFRARLPATPWLKLNLKWGPGGNLLGLLDFTYNLDK